MQNGLWVLWTLSLSATAVGVAVTRAGAADVDVPLRAEDVKPVGKGQQAPSATLRAADGSTVNLDTLFEQGPTMLIFYRGGWCPYCSTHLGQIQKAESDLRGLGFQILAISPDGPEALRKSADLTHLTYRLLSDSEMVLARAFGLAFRVDDATLERYKGFGIDLEKASGQSHHLLPVPAVYLVDTKGTIQFAHWNPDYRARLSAPEVLAAARAMSGAEAAAP